MAAKTARIPVYLLTGYLGSGKTTLLAAWLKETELAHTALIVNEAGEVGLDQHLLRQASESAALVADACVCCTGLPGLEQALAELFWSRLHRKIDAFEAVFIETTGLAKPLPIVQLIEHDPLLRERYRLAGVIVTLSAGSGSDVLTGRAEALSQINAADLVIITKADLASGATLEVLRASVAELNPHAALAVSSKASLRAGPMLALLSARAGADKTGATSSIAVQRSPQDRHDHDHGGEASQHDAQAFFLALPRSIEPRALREKLAAWIAQHQAGLLRLKGLAHLCDGAWVTVQWSIGDTQVAIALFDSSPDLASAQRCGLTVIVEKGVYQKTRTALVGAFSES